MAKGKHRKNRYVLVIMVFTIISGLAYYIYDIPYRGKGSDRIRIPYEWERLPLYYRISSSYESLDEKTGNQLIDAVQKSNWSKGVSVEQFVRENTPGVAEEFRTWEAYRLEGTYYVCFVGRVFPGGPGIIFVWKVEPSVDGNEAGIKLISKQGSGEFDESIDKGFPVYRIARKVFLKRSEADRRILLFFIDRKDFTYNDRQYMDYCYKITSRRYNIPISKLREIVGGYNGEVDEILMKEAEKTIIQSD